MAGIAIHPGEHLAEELHELGMSAAELGRRLKVPTNRITGILNGQRAITGDTALRLAHFFGTSPEFWLNLQSLYELRIAEKRAGKAINALPTLVPANGRAVSLLPPVDTGDDMRPEYDFSGGVRGKHHLKYRSGKIIFPRSG
jgi:addiction module HigA family antidote